MSQSSGGYGDGPGIDSEELVKELLQKSGWAVKELRKAADGGMAPLLENEIDDSLRVVDFQAHHSDYSTHYVEVKSKEEAVYYGIEDELRHGWERSKHEDYVDFRRTYTECPVYVFVHERETGIILRQRVRELSIAQEITDQSKLIPYGADEPICVFRRDDFDTVTDDVSQYSTGFAQSGLVKDDINLSPFGHESRDNGSLFDYGGAD